MNRDELLKSLEDIAEAFDMRVRPYSATSGQAFAPQLCSLCCFAFTQLINCSFYLTSSIAWPCYASS